MPPLELLVENHSKRIKVSKIKHWSNLSRELDGFNIAYNIAPYKNYALT